MTKKNLRDRAEKEFREKAPTEAKSEADLRALVHELGVHQIELELQNEELKRTRQELVESEQKYRDMFDFAPGGYITFDESGTINEINLAAASLIGVTRDNLVNRQFQNFLSLRCIKRFNSFCASVVASDRTQTCEVELNDRRVPPHWILIEGRSIDGKPEAPPRFRAALYDLTERRHIEDLKRSNRELEQFAYVASHDLREPLRMMTSFSELLQQRYKGRLDPDADEFISYIVNGATRMNDLINDLLDYSRVASHGKPFEPVDMNAVADQVIGNLTVAIHEADARIDVSLLPTVRADRHQMVQLFQNLISNAIKFRREDPVRIEIGADDRGDAYEFFVKDNGIGIDSEYHEKIFVIFQRLNTRNNYAGTGIGLAICRRIVERHQGRIWVESAEGKGSTFYFTIPSGQAS